MADIQYGHEKLSPPDRETRSSLQRETRSLLVAGRDLPPFRVLNPQGGSSFLLIGDHAGNAVPGSLGKLGMDDAALGLHIALDIGVEALGTRLSAMLDATFIRQVYSRLVVDCNRSPDAADLIAAVSDGTAVPGNERIAAEGRATRLAEIHNPYQTAIASELAHRDVHGQVAILISLHSFTPVMNGRGRPWEIGVLYKGGDTRFARAVLAALRQRGDIAIGDNEPYCMDSIDYTVPLHCDAVHRPYVELEVRQDLLQSGSGVERMAHILEDGLVRASSSAGIVKRIAPMTGEGRTVRCLAPEGPARHFAISTRRLR